MLAELSPSLIVLVHRAAKLLSNAKKIAVLTGAGVSAESGVPTFRDKQTGLWANFRAEDLATPTAFARDPQLVWSWYQWRRQLIRDKTPNAAHLALADWQQYARDHQQRLTLITQNVDDLHEQAGSTVTHLHGHLWRNRCHHCHTPYVDQQSPANHSTSNPQDSNTHQDSSVPSAPHHKTLTTDSDDRLITCHLCGGYIRPDIVWFGESLPMDAWQDAEQAAAECDVFISLGTSSLVYPAAGLAQLAKKNGAKIVEINPNPTPNTQVDISLAAAAGIVMPALVTQIRALKTDQ